MIKQNKNGSTLILVMIVAFSLEMTLIGVLAVAGNRFKQVQHSINFEQSFYIAESGIETAIDYVEENMHILPSTKKGKGNIGGGKFTYVIKRISSKECDITATGTYKESSRTIILRGVRNATYAQFAFFTEDNGDIYFKSKEEFFGPVHTDSKPYFSGNPEFFDEVTTKSSTYAGDISAVIFNKGFEKNVDNGSMASVDFPGLKALAKNEPGAIYLKGDTAISFDDGIMKISNSSANWNNKEKTIANEQLIYIAYKSNNSPGRLFMNGGTLDGKVTIVTEDDIFITNHTRYKVSPLDDPNSDDALGLISRDDVFLYNAPNNIDIHATIMATGAKSEYNDGSFGVYNLNATYGFKNHINLLGGIVQQVRGAVGYFNKNTGETYAGYNKRYIFDKRFKTDPPPYYPAISGKITYKSWAETAGVSL